VKVYLFVDPRNGFNFHSLNSEVCVQYIVSPLPKKKRGGNSIKLYVLTEPDGTILKFAVYTGQLDDHGGKGHAANVVLSLMEDYLDVGHSVYMDNYYYSFDLAVKLLNRNTYCTGTLRVDRKNTPIEVKNKQSKKGETVFQSR
jgi:hypothetical protein